MEKVGDFQATVIFSLLYFVFIVPIGFFANLKSDYFRVKKFPIWIEVKEKLYSIKDLKNQG